jgi:hypothetical protein
LEHLVVCDAVRKEDKFPYRLRRPSSQRLLGQWNKVYALTSAVVRMVGGFPAFRISYRVPTESADEDRDDSTKRRDR